jgi:uridine kinase
MFKIIYIAGDGRSGSTTLYGGLANAEKSLINCF